MQDPVCGMTVEPHKAAGTEVYNGVTYAFCSPHCLEKFRADPAQYMAQPTSHGVNAHTEVRLDGGACPLWHGP